MNQLLPISAVIATRNREQVLARTLNSLAEQSHQPHEILLVDASSHDATQQVGEEARSKLAGSLQWIRAEVAGAATQRNQGVQQATQNTILFCDDDIIFEPRCIERLWTALQSDPRIGGVNAMITNQRYLPPGWISRSVFRILHGQTLPSYAGKCLYGAMNLLPEDREDLPEIMPMEWLNTTCTLYRREALPDPVFPPLFQGASILEDATLSCTVRQRWRLVNARTARIYHDSQMGEHKRDPAVLAEMELVNRAYLMTEVLGHRRQVDYARLLFAQAFTVASTLQSARGWKELPAVVRGKWRAWRKIRFAHRGGLPTRSASRTAVSLSS